MPHNIKILSSKLTVAGTPGTIVRERLLSLMDLGVGKKLTTLVAGAGYGKTTLAAQALSGWSRKVVWYRLDASDLDLVTFISYLVAGIRKYHSEFGLELLEYMGRIHNPADAVCSTISLLLAELEAISREEWIIVLDDFHTVKESREIREAMEILLRDLPASFRLILTSRSRPNLALSRLRAMREMVEIGEKDLAFTPTEIERLYAQVFDFPLGPAEIDTICHKMGGWVSGLILLCHSLQGKPAWEIGPNLVGLKGSQREIFDYLEENVYGSLSPQQQEFLLRTSIFHRVTPALCDRLLNVDDSADVLRRFEDNHLFISSIEREEHWYFYHQLFRDFLLSRLEESRDRASILGAHRDAAMLLERCGEEDEAVEHYLQAGEFERACRLLEHAGRKLFREGRFQLLSSYLGGIPEELLDEHPWISFQQAQLKGLCGNLDAALRKYDRALECFVERKDKEGIQSCLVESGLIDFQTGDLKKAQEKFQELLQWSDSDQQGLSLRSLGLWSLDPKLRIEILGYLIYISSHLGQMDLADRCFEEAVLLTNDLKEEALRSQCLVWLYYYRGFRYAFSSEYERVLEAAETMKVAWRGREPGNVVDLNHQRHPGESRDPCFIRLLDPGFRRDDAESTALREPGAAPLGYYLLVSMACYHLQLYSRGLESARKGLSLLGGSRGGKAGITTSGWPSPRVSPRGERGFPDVSHCWLLAYAALNAAELGDVVGSLEDAEESLGCFRKMGCRYGEAFACCVLHEVHLKSGNGAAAERYARSGLEAVKGMTTPSYEVQLMLRLAGSLIEKEEYAGASELLNDVDERVGRLMQPVPWYLLHARLHWLENRPEAGLSSLICALESCRQRRLDSLLLSQQHWIVPLLVEAFAQGQMNDYITEIMAGMTHEVHGRLSLLQRGGNSNLSQAASRLLREVRKHSAHCLQVQLFGKFKVVRDGREIPSTAWKSRKAKTLFQYLIHSRARGYTNKEILMELLWPEEDPALTAKRFHVALASLRKTLEPEIERGIPSAFISRVGDSYRIDLGTEGWADIDRFQEECRLAAGEGDLEKAIMHLLNAESLYSGDFLREEPYSEWCMEVRENHRRDYLQLLKRISACYEKQGDHARAIDYCNRYLELEPYAEDVCRSLMTLYCQAGDKSGMARIFKKCRENMTRELDCDPSHETEQLYRKLLAGRP